MRKWTVVATLAAPVALVGCTLAEIREALGFAGEEAGKTVVKVAADPSLAATPQGIAILLGTAAAGFLSRELSSLTVRGAKAGAGPLAKLLAKLFSKGS